MVAEHPRAENPSPTTPASKDDSALETIAALEGRYRFRQPDEVRAFLAAHPQVLALAVEAAARIPEFLPTDQPLELEVVRDPEDEQDAGALFAVVPTLLEPEDTRRRMRRLLREWLIDAGRPVGLLFNVDVEYR